MNTVSEQQGLYRSEYEHDACGVGMVANLSGLASHEIVVQGMTVLKRLMHRGATGNDPETGDGAGLLMKIPHEFFRKVCGIDGDFGVAMVFGGEGEEAKIKSVVENEGHEVIAWRDVPLNPDAIGHDARSVMPRIRQIFIDCTDEKRLYIIRRQIEKATTNAYICSLSSRTIVYKGLLLATQIEKFYPDLSDPDFVSPFAIIHQRYSTNTFPTWELAHPFRAIAHNGEINAIKGNLNALAARESSLESPVFGEELKKVLPIVHGGQSDSASLDNIFELLIAAGRDAPHAMMMLIPQAWGVKYHMSHDVRAFYEYHSALMEPWDGPAAVAFTDGIGLGATLDRNGLRPARWTLTKNGLFVLASETGVLDIDPRDVERHGRLKPGAILWLDLEKHRLMEDAEIKTLYARRRPYRRWVKENHIPVTGLFTEIVPPSPDNHTASEQIRFGWTLEDIETILRPMAETGREPIGAMGNDAALACLRGDGNGHFKLFDCFHQLFSQVTNPSIDPIREELVMSIMTYIGNQGNILAETPEHARLVKMTRPVITDDELGRIRKIPKFPSKTLPLNIEGQGIGRGWLKASLDKLAAESLAAAENGAKIIILSDRTTECTNHSRACIPSLLAVAAANNVLAKAGIRPSVGIIVESGEVREAHHLAVLLGFGATAVNPWLALATVAEIGERDKVKATANYITALCKGVMKIMSKMGISTLRSYRSAKIFEAVGLGPKLIKEYFDGVTSPVGGLELDDIEKTVDAEAPSLLPGGEYRAGKGGTEHLWTPQRIADFREAVRNNDYARFKRTTDDIERNSHVTLRSQLEFRRAEHATPIESVATADSIAKHFVGGAMSLGSISPEAHETIALAMNGLDLMSNSGEGGENPKRFGTGKNSAVKQVASGRFGVTIEYLCSAKDLQIKLAQGAKPGEGGQLPAHKVNDFVARLRHAKPGTPLISPPPHHDIYSIEDLAQLVYDLKCANPEARVSVKLVSEAGVGTIAAGVAKAHADVIVISGFDGGTGAVPLTSMKHAGLPWEPGLAEAHQTLLKNNLRHRVKLQVDGQLVTARDIVVAAMLGADEFAFGTSMLISLGCVQCRNCNMNCCPVGIATQKDELRRRFAGKAEHLQRYFRFLAEGVRELLASLGLRSLAEARGRSDMLKAVDGCRFDFRELLQTAECTEETFHELPAASLVSQNYDFRELIPAGEENNPQSRHTICNSDRSVGAALSGWLVKQSFAGTKNLTYSFTGVAGQSFGAFLAKGITFNLKGEANDYVGKSLSGGIITIAPLEVCTRSGDSDFRPEDNVIAGNVIAYGATSGSVFINGQVGERFGIRNSGATLVAEGVGDHGCEYMTGGTVVVLGPIGVNFAAGMTGGTAYVYDEKTTLDLNSNLDAVDLFPVEETSQDEKVLLKLLEEHSARTGSPKARRIIANWQNERPKFVKVVPVRE
ncbi:MAG: glutamate synthase large subunit [Kiritimatiellae bacterium]|nr:glutamate synthase large subunit [Kiritimatiellia bacterium]